MGSKQRKGRMGTLPIMGNFILVCKEGKEKVKGDKVNTAGMGFLLA